MPPNELITIQELHQTLDILAKIYDSVRLINPLKKKVVAFSEGVLKDTQDSCYTLLSRGKACSNCISMRAFNEKDTCFKLEAMDHKIFAVIAIPVQEAAELYILELAKDVTGSMVAENSGYSENAALLQALRDAGQQQVKDGLTGIFNRRFIDERLPVDILNSSTHTTPYTVILTDIDHFKHVNDTYGHIAGDHVLKKFTRLLEESIHGKTGWAARYGGEEFIICLENEPAASAVLFTEALRSTIENSAFDYGGNTIRITSSFGVCTLSKSWDIQAEKLLDCSDKNLYTAKASGRNQVIASEL